MFLCLLAAWSFGRVWTTLPRLARYYGYPFRESFVGDLLDKFIAFAAHSTSRRCDQCQFRATMLPRHFHLPLFRRRKRNLEPLRSPHRTPVQAIGVLPRHQAFHQAFRLHTHRQHDPGSRPGALSMEEGCRYLPVHRPYFRLHELSASSYQLRRLLGLMNRPRFVSGYATLASRVVPMRPFVGEEERELGRVKFTYYKKANKQNRSTFMYITYWRSRQAPRRLGLAINRHQSCMAREHGFDIFISANRTLVK